MAKITLEQLMKKRFLFEGSEVQMTGRYAKKSNRSKTFLLFEIRPSDMNATPFKKWVRISDLYEIHHPLGHRVEFAEDLLDAVKRCMNKNN